LTYRRRKSKIIRLETDMGFTRESAVERAKQDLAARLRVEESEISEGSIEKVDFPNMSLGAPTDGEMSAQMISTGWRIPLSAAGREYEYRADKYQLRLKDFDGTNHVIAS
jgi:hypothetical protein